MSYYDDDDPGTERIPASLVSPVFRDHAVELAGRLSRCTSEPARTLAREAVELAKRFDDFLTRKPASHERSAAVRQLFDLTERAKPHLS
jgi:hypothetical protein